MPLVLELAGGANKIFSALHTRAEWARDPLVDLRQCGASQERVDALCDSAEQALKRGLRRDVTEADWGLVRDVGLALTKLLDEHHASSLAASIRDDSALTLRLREEVIGLPWELMIVNGFPLCEIVDLGRQVVAQHTGLNALPPPRVLALPIRVLIVADPGLEYATKEAWRLAERLGPDSRFVVDVLTHIGLPQLTRALGGTDILHFAGHAQVRADVGRTGWKLMDGTYFTVDVVQKAGIAQWPVLVFANACHERPVVRRPGDMGLDALSLALLWMGVRHFIGTHAPIPDHEMAVRFALGFYDHLAQGMTVGASIRFAGQALREDDAERGRIVAAGYVHYGDPIDRLFQPAETADVTSSGLDAVIRGLDAEAQGNLDEARRWFDQISEPTRSKLIASLERDRTRRQHGSDTLRASQVPDLPVGFGPYKLHRLIGDSGYRRVYHAESSSTVARHAAVALALPLDQRPAAGESQRRAFFELQSKLRDPRLVEILDINIFDGLFYIAYELVEGVTLADEAQRRPPPWSLQETCDLLESIGGALAAAHRENIFHTALSPRHIVRTADGGLKILDVGQAAALQRAGMPVTARREAEPYRSPEQWLSFNLRHEAQSDLWALGVMAYEWLTGRHPFATADPNTNWEEAICRGTLVSPLLSNPELPAATVRFLERALSRTRQARFADAGELVAEVRRLRLGVRLSRAFFPDIEPALRAPVSLFHVQTTDEADTIERLADIAAANDLDFRVWTVTQGLARRCIENTESPRYEGNPEGLLRDWLMCESVPTMLVLPDFAQLMGPIPLTMRAEPFHEIGAVVTEDLSAEAFCWDLDAEADEHVYQRTVRQPNLARSLRDIAAQRRHKVVIISASASLPPQLASSFQLCEALPPDPMAIGRMVAEATGEQGPEWLPQFVFNTVGMTASAIHDCLRLSRERNDTVDQRCLEDVRRLKARLGHLTFETPRVSLADVAGVEELKRWFSAREAFLSDPLTHIMVPPRGLLLGGFPGCGKSLCARAIAGELSWPLLRLDVGALLSHFVGDAEANLRAALWEVEMASPAVVLLDDVEKSFSPLAVYSNGPVSRLFHTLLTWMQERTSRTLLVATASDDSALPSELVRAGRFDAVFFLDLPNRRERARMLEQRWTEVGLPGEDCDWHAMARLSDGCAGADLAGAVADTAHALAVEDGAAPMALLSSNLKSARARALAAGDLAPARRRWLTFAIPASSPEVSERYEI